MNQLVAGFLLLLTLGGVGVADASLLFFWRAEGTTLSATDDLYASDSTAAANGTVSLDASAAYNGSTGILADAASERYVFDMSSNDICSQSTGSMAAWINVATWVNGVNFLQCHNSASGAQYIGVGLTSTDEVWLAHGDGTTPLTVPTTSANLSTGTWYFVTGSWDDATNYRRIRVYNSSGTLIQEVEDASTNWGPPATTNQVRIGELAATAMSIKIDNVFLGSTVADADTFLCNRDITSYTQYAACGGAQTFGFRLRVNQ